MLDSESQVIVALHAAMLTLPVVLANVLRGHTLHSEEAGVSAYVLTPHGLQAADPSTDLYDPGAHAEHIAPLPFGPV